MKKHNQLLLVFLAFGITAACVWLLSSSTVIGAMCGAFLSVVGAYTALDLRAIVKETGMLPKGEYSKADRWKYLVGVAALFLLFVWCLVKEYFSSLDLELAYGFLGPGIVVIIGFIISGMKMNKAATLCGID